MGVTHGVTGSRMPRQDAGGLAAATAANPSVRRLATVFWKYVCKCLATQCNVRLYVGPGQKVGIACWL
jgi:hypothetical protein